MSATTLSRGDLIAGRYRVLRLLGCGGMGEVYEVHDRELDQTLALKTLRADVENEAEARRLFDSEIRTSRIVTHRHVARAFDAGFHHDGRRKLPYMTMELLRGERLDERIEGLGRLDPDEVLHIAREITSALASAHASGVIHGDLKCGNVVLESTESGRGERAVLTDLGLGSMVGESDSPTGSVTGSPAYMAPEQVAGGTLTHATDLYSLGILLFRMLTGRLPFESDDALSTAVQRLSRDAPSPRQHAPGVDPAWERIIRRCLEKDPARRFLSAGEVLDALEIFRHPPKPLWRRALIPSLAAISFAGLAFVLSVSDRLSPPQPETTIKSSAPIAGDAVQLTFDEGLEIDPAISPDGSTVAYAVGTEHGFEIHLRSLVTGSSAITISETGSAIQPAWSPDGALLSYTSLDQGGIWVVPSGGGHARRLAESGSRPVFSPDGQRIAFQQDDGHDFASRAIPALPPSVLLTVPIDGGEITALTVPGQPPGGHGEPNWSPNGKWIAFSTGDRRNTRVWITPAEGGEARPVGAEQRINLHPLFAEDGHALYFLGLGEDDRQAGSWRIWRAEIDPESAEILGQPEPIIRLGVARIRHLSIAADGSSLIYGALRTTSNLWSIALDRKGGAIGEARVITAGSLRTSRPAISADGRYLAYDRWGVGTNVDLWLQELEGQQTKPRQLTTSPLWDSQATWLDDGRLAFLSDRADERTLRILDPITGVQDSVAVLDSKIDWARLSADGRFLYYHYRADDSVLDTWRLEIESGEHHRLTQDKSMAAFPIPSPSGDLLALEIERDGSTQIAVMPSDGSSAPKAITDEPGENWPFAWFADGDRIAFAAKRSSYWSLRWISRSTGEERTLVEEFRPDSYLRYPAVNPQSDRVVYERSSTVGDLWQVELR